MRNYILIYLIALFSVLSPENIYSQSPVVSDPYLIINAGKDDPLYTTYTAAMDRSRLYGDKGYKMNYYENCGPLSYGSDQGGGFFTIWEINAVVVDKMSDFHEKPVVTASFPDMAILNYQPWAGLSVEETFFVYSSQIALVDMVINNRSNEELVINLYPVLESDTLRVSDFGHSKNAYILNHFETKKRLISNLSEKYPYPTQLRDIFTGDFQPYSYGAYDGSKKDFYNIIKTDFYSDNRSDSLNLSETGEVNFVSLHARITLKPGEEGHLRYLRGIQDQAEDQEALMQVIEQVKQEPLQDYIDANIALFSNIPRIEFNTNNEKIIYLSSFNLVRGCMLPPTGETKYNFYVFSREPLWGWGHGHQVLHESLSMLTYVYLDPLSAQNSQRVYMEQQRDDGFIAYRHGPRGLQDYPHEDMPTTSSPFFSWINWEIYKVSKDKQFLADAYKSGVRYTDWLLRNRDQDKDGTLEWGPYGIIENVRDWYNAVFQVSAERYLDVDKEDISDELECLDLSLMVVKEMRSLSEMASTLGMKKDAIKWNEKADKLSELINERMWEEKSGFFYHVNRVDHSFYFMTRDLRRQEIIGFLPMWAQATSAERAEQLVRTLSNPGKFWRKYGVPTLAADDPWYSPYVDYCCKWNGPVWLLWDYMIFDGLVKYGYKDQALELAGKMIDAASVQLSKNHNFWESYSPDNDVLNCPSNYIWDSVLAKLLIEVYGVKD